MSNFLKKNIIKSSKPYVIAEIGINHNGDINLAKKMILSAKKSGASCVKFQKFIAQKYISKYASKANYQSNYKKFKNESQLNIISKSQLNIKEIHTLQKFCKKKKNRFSLHTF